MAHHAPLGSLEHFDPNGPNTLEQWLLRFRIFCDANGIMPEPTNAENNYFQESNQRRNLFLTFLGPRAFAVLQAACLPHDPAGLPIPLLEPLLKQHFQPAGLVEANRYTFQQRMQQPNETVIQYISALQALAVPCEWDQFYNQAMKSQLILGLRHQDTRQKLISTPNLTWVMAKSIAQQDDAIRAQMRTLTQAHNQANSRVNAVFKKEEKKNENSPSNPKNNSNPKKETKTFKPEGKNHDKKFGPCHRCTRHHDPDTCAVSTWECKYCHQIGHMVKTCPVKKKKKVHVNAVFKGTSDSNDDEFVDSLLDLE